MLKLPFFLFSILVFSLISCQKNDIPGLDSDEANWKLVYEYEEGNESYEFLGRDVNGNAPGEALFTASVVSWKLNAENQTENTVEFSVSSTVSTADNKHLFSMVYFVFDPKISKEVTSFSSQEEKLQAMERLFQAGTYPAESDRFKLLLQVEDPYSTQQCPFSGQYVNLEVPDNEVVISEVERYEHPLFGLTLKVRQQFSFKMSCDPLKESRPEMITGELVSFFQPCHYNSTFEIVDCNF